METANERPIVRVQYRQVQRREAASEDVDDVEASVDQARAGREDDAESGEVMLFGIECSRRR